MKKITVLGLLFVSVCVRTAFPQGNTVNLPSSAHSAGAQAGYFVDPDTGKRVYRLSDRSLCPGGATHFYSYSNQFSIAGDMVFDCKYDASNNNLVGFPVYDKNYKLLYSNAVTASNAPNISFRMVQWSQSRRVLFAQQGTRLWELDPFNGTSRQIADFGGKTFTSSSGATMTVGNIVALSVGPGDRLMVHVQPVGNYTVMAIGTFELATGRYSFLGVPVLGQYAPYGFDEATYSQNPGGRVTLQNSYASAYSYASTLTTPVKYEDNNGHRGFFCGSNGRCYKVSGKNDTLSNGSVGQIGCPNISPWISEMALYNDFTGKRELIWACDMLAGSILRSAMAHFSRSQAPDVFFGDGASASPVDWIARYQVSYDSSGNPNKVTGTPVATARSNSACGYWAQPRSTSDPTGTRALFDSSASNTTYISKENGVIKTSCVVDVYVAEYSSAPAVTLSATPGSLSFATVVNVSPASQTAQVSTSSSTQSWTVSSNQAWLTLSKASGTGSSSVSVSINPQGLLTGSYSGAVTVTASGAQGSPASINVSLTISAPTVAIASLSVSPNPVIGPNTATGTLTLSGNAPSGGAVVPMTGTSGVVAVPSSVTVPAGQKTATFTAMTWTVSSRQQGTITATYNGSVQAVLIVDPQSASLKSETLSPNSVAAGSAATGTVTLSSPAPSGGSYVALSSNNALAGVPAGVTVPAGSTSATFVMTTAMTLVQQQATVTATYSGKSVQATATIVPPKLVSVSVAPNPIDSGVNATGTVRLSSPAPSGGAVVTLTSSFRAVIPPPSVVIPAGATSATFKIGSWSVLDTWQLTISASWNGVTVSTPVTLSP